MRGAAKEGDIVTKKLSSQKAYLVRFDGEKYYNFLTDDLKDALNEIAKNINVFYKGNSQNKLPSEVNDLEFEGSNFDKNKYNLEVMSLTNVNDKNGTLEVKYRLRTIDNSEISSIFSKVVSGFKKDNNSYPNPLTKSKVRLAH